ncbi:GNAT family N-acetyltransferase [Hamadaea tsunoensis]|uniref:GNAT family N-acetyltransferase n=1 Tax=Hamadaea tsunoensis TaxID=53368 RepID=UPI0004283EA0|nr:GNAT family N-acetyltransferase [Hamadaea tsunoensis]
MSRIQVRSFTADDIDAAAGLLAARHRAHRRTAPLLSPSFEDPSVAAQAVAAAFAQPDASGAFGVRDGQPAGFVLGAPKGSELWGPNVWVESAGHACTDPEDLRDLYAVAAQRWVDEGRTAHYALAPADPALLNSWYRLGFGQQHAHGIRDTAVEVTPSKVAVRPAVRADIPLLAQLDLELPHHQGRSPVFSAGSTPDLQEALDEWESDFDDPEYAVFVAEHEGAVIGSAIGCALSKSGSHTALARTENAGFLGFAAVLPAARGLGAGRALGETVCVWARDAGFTSVVTDWRVTNLLSSRAWPALGFEETFIRVHRVVGY